jgi:hypothetical protein
MAEAPCVFGAMVTHQRCRSPMARRRSCLVVAHAGRSGFALPSRSVRRGTIGSLFRLGPVTNATVVPASVSSLQASSSRRRTPPATRHDLFRRLTRRWTWRWARGRPTTEVFRFLSRTTGLVGLLACPRLHRPGSLTVVGYVACSGRSAVREEDNPSGGHTMGRRSPCAGSRCSWRCAVRGRWLGQAVGDGDKIARDGAGTRSRNGTPVAAARNKSCVWVTSGGRPASRLSALPEPAAGAGRADHLHAAREGRSPGRPIETFSVRDMNVTQGRTPRGRG